MVPLRRPSGRIRCRAHIAEQRTILDSATVRDYLPVLVERAVRKLLTPEETGS
jgi:hypothetical protein